MARGDRFKLSPTLTVQHWRRKGWNQLLHYKSGNVVTFVGPDATRRRNECLRQLNRLEPTRPIRLTKTGTEWLDETGFSLLEMLVVVGVVLTVAAIGIPILWEALKAVRGFVALVDAVTIH